MQKGKYVSTVLLKALFNQVLIRYSFFAVWKWNISIGIFLKSVLRFSCFRNNGEICRSKYLFKLKKNDTFLHISDRIKISRVPLWIDMSLFFLTEVNIFSCLTCLIKHKLLKFTNNVSYGLKMLKVYFTDLTVRSLSQPAVTFDPNFDQGESNTYPPDRFSVHFAVTFLDCWRTIVSAYSNNNKGSRSNVNKHELVNGVSCWDARRLFIICVIVYNLYYCCYAKTSSSAVQKRHSKVYGKPIAPSLYSISPWCMVYTEPDRTNFLFIHIAYIRERNICTHGLHND